MTQATIPSGLTIEYESWGSEADPPILLVMGFGTQLIGWPRAFCAHLAGGGLHVIAFDNRDTGLSSKFDGIPANVDEILAAGMAEDWQLARELAPYTLADMATDAIGLLDALGIDRANVLGASMGGFIAQTMAIEYPERLLTLTSMMSTTGEPEYGQSKPEVLQILLEPGPTDREAYIASSERWLAWHSRRYPELEATKLNAAESFDRGLCPQGTSRQLAAMISSGDRAEALRQLTVPTLVIHGTDDTLIDPSGGRRTAELIPGAQFVPIQDMGHDRPQPLWDQICQPVWEFTR